MIGGGGPFSLSGRQGPQLQQLRPVGGIQVKLFGCRSRVACSSILQVLFQSTVPQHF